MQQSPLTLRQKLIDAVDERYHVKDMAAIVEVLGTLERLPVTKEMLETTRLGKTVNEFRKKINNEKLAKRAKALVKKWRDAVLISAEPQQSGRSLNGSTSIGEVPGPGLARLQQSTALSSLQGYNSSTSSPKLQTSSSKVSPAGSNNSNSLSPRVLTSFNSINSSSNNRNGSNSNVYSSESLHRNATLGAAQHHGSAIHSPLNSASLKTSSPSSASYLSNKSKSSPYANTTYTQSSTKSPALPPSYSYAPNSENVARTNAANKRYRKDEDSGIGVNSGPPAKKSRINGTGGTLDDPMLLDEHSKDSVISRTSDQSDGSSKPLSLVSSSAALSAAPSPLTGTLDSDISPPLSVEAGATNNNKALITNEDKLSPNPPTTSGDENSGIGSSGAVENAVSEPSPAQPKRGRKRKKQEPLDAAALLREQIAKAQAEGKIRIQERRPLDDLPRRSPPVKPVAPTPATLKQPQLSAISKEDPLIKNEIVEKYLESQTELRARMERQALDAVANNEIKGEEDGLPSESKKSVDDDDSKKKRKKDKKKKEGSAEKSGPVFPSESEILSRLPPIDPDILAEFKNFTFCEDTKEEVVKESHPDNKETDNLQNKTASLSSTDQQPASNGAALDSSVPATIELSKKIISTKIDWGDSDEDEDFEEVKIPEAKIQEDQVDAVPVIVAMSPASTPELQPISEERIEDEEFKLTDEISSQETKIGIEETIVPLREVEESEVERLHTEKINNLNGNNDKDGQFREWQETLTMESLNGDLLHILPYTVIDF